MCTINGKCGCNRTGSGFLLAVATAIVQALLTLIGRTLQLLLVVLILTARWAGPRAWRLTRRGYRAARHRFATRTVVMDRPPVAELPQQPTALTLADLMQKQEANAR